MIRPKYTKKDANHHEIVLQARELGMIVWDTADIGGEILDLVVCWRGKCLPVEIKAPGKIDDLTEDEEISINKLRTAGVDPVIATQIEDVIAAF